MLKWAAMKLPVKLPKRRVLPNFRKKGVQKILELENSSKTIQMVLFPHLLIEKDLISRGMVRSEGAQKK